jgi:hypothetical protein
LFKRFARSGYDVDLIVGRVDAALTLPDAPGAKIIELQRRNVRGLLLPFYRYLRVTKPDVVSPDVVSSAEDHLNVVVLFADIAARWRARQRTTPIREFRLGRDGSSNN